MSLSDEIKARIDLAAYVGRFITLKKRGNHYVACCPFHGEHTPSFYVTPEKGLWTCFGACATSGSVIDFAMRFHGLDMNQTLRELAAEAGINPNGPRQQRPVSPPAPRPVEVSEPPSEAWQHYAGLVVDMAEKTLWSEQGKPALNYLMKARALRVDIIQRARLGYIPGPYDQWRRPFPEWTESERAVSVPCGIVIPHFAGGNLWAVRVRRAAGEHKYGAIRGGSRCLYWSDDVSPRMPVLIVEGEFDCLAALQAAEDVVCPVALASASNAKINPRWWSVFAAAPLVLARMDQDQAGQKALAALSDRFPVKVVNVPAGKDVNEFLQYAGWIAVCDWLKAEVAA